MESVSQSVSVCSDYWLSSPNGMIYVIHILKDFDTLHCLHMGLFYAFYTADGFLLNY
jgi:hypothetical protein